MRASTWIAALALSSAAACGPGVPSPTPPPAGPAAGPDLSTALAPLAWLVGDWAREDVAYGEHWVAIAGALYGVGLGDDDAWWEATVIDDFGLPGVPPGRVGMLTRTAERDAVVLVHAGGDAARARFENPAGGFPAVIEYAVVRGALHIDVSDPEPDSFPDVHGELARRAAERAPEVEAADAATPRPLATAPVGDDAEIRWEPSWSRVSPTGRIAASAGRTRVVTGGGVTWRGSYLTVWRLDGGAWTPIHELVRDEHAP